MKIPVCVTGCMVQAMLLMQLTVVVDKLFAPHADSPRTDRERGRRRQETQSLALWQEQTWSLGWGKVLSELLGERRACEDRPSRQSESERERGGPHRSIAPQGPR